MLTALLLVALPRVAWAFDCQGTMPLPDDVRVVPPATDVPQELARFSGAWSGAWRDTGGVDTQCNTLVIEVDLTKDFGPSASGKTVIIASSEGNAPVPGHPEMKLGLNVFAYPKK